GGCRPAGGNDGDTPHQLRLGRAGARHARTDRPGPGAPAGAQLPGRVAGINGVVSGSTITQVRNSIYLINVDMRAEHRERTSLESIRSLQIPLRDGNVVPLRQIASFEYTQEYPIVWRRDRIPTLTLQADVVPGLLPATAVTA